MMDKFVRRSTILEIELMHASSSSLSLSLPLSLSLSPSWSVSLCYVADSSTLASAQPWTWE